MSHLFIVYTYTTYILTTQRSQIFSQVRCKHIINSIVINPQIYKYMYAMLCVWYMCSNHNECTRSAVAIKKGPDTIFFLNFFEIFLSNWHETVKQITIRNRATSLGPNIFLHTNVGVAIFYVYCKNWLKSGKMWNFYVVCEKCRAAPRYATALRKYINLNNVIMCRSDVVSGAFMYIFFSIQSILQIQAKENGEKSHSKKKLLSE